MRLRPQRGAVALQRMGRLPALTTQQVESSFAEVCAAVGVDVEGWKHLVDSALHDMSAGAESGQLTPTTLHFATPTHVKYQPS